jgi:hypothetical protein
MNFLVWLESQGLSALLRGSEYGYPFVLTCHSIGMAVVVGIVLIYSARLLGYAPGLPLSIFDGLFKLAWAGFALNAVSGALLFISNPVHLIENLPFLLKMAMIVAGGLSVWRLARVQALSLVGDAVLPASTETKIIAWANIIFWLGAITSGRIIAYTLSEG